MRATALLDRPATPVRALVRHAVLAAEAEVARVPVVRRSGTAVPAHWGLTADALDAAAHIIGELAAHAAQHGRGNLTLRLVLTPTARRIAVHDSGDAHVAPGCDGRDPDEHGRGLAIVEVLSAHCHVTQHGNGRRVDVTLPVAP